MDIREKVAVMLSVLASNKEMGGCVEKADAILALFAEERADMLRVAERNEDYEEALERGYKTVKAREATLVEALELACRLMGHADIDWPESIDAAIASVKEGK